MSRRGFENIEAIMPKIQGAVEERKKKVNSNIDLATSENWLMRPELVELCKEAISAKLEPHVSQTSLQYTVVSNSTLMSMISTCHTPGVLLVTRPSLRRMRLCSTATLSLILQCSLRT